MLPVNRNISIYKGDTFDLEFRLRARSGEGDPGGYVNLTGATGKAQIRLTEDSAEVLAEFAVTCGADGTVLITLTAEQTAALVNGGMYDVQIEFPDGSIKTYLRGTVSVVKEVTRA
jgi:hypothetical protein